jgi:hypothetical protein
VSSQRIEAKHVRCTAEQAGLSKKAGGIERHPPGAGSFACQHQEFCNLVPSPVATGPYRNRPLP